MENFFYIILIGFAVYKTFGKSLAETISELHIENKLKGEKENTRQRLSEQAIPPAIQDRINEIGKND